MKTFSRWDVARINTNCMNCKGFIGAGERLRLVGPRSWPYCVGCAKTRFGMEPPDDMPAPTAVETARQVMEMTRPEVPAHIKAFRSDPRMRQAEREPGEDG